MAGRERSGYAVVENAALFDFDFDWSGGLNTVDVDILLDES